MHPPKKTEPWSETIIFFFEELVIQSKTYSEKGKRIPKALRSSIETCDEDISRYEASEQFHSCCFELFFYFFFFFLQEN
jgi:hypothetical protein